MGGASQIVHEEKMDGPWAAWRKMAASAGSATGRARVMYGANARKREMRRDKNPGFASCCTRPSSAAALDFGTAAIEDRHTSRIYVQRSTLIRQPAECRSDHGQSESSLPANSFGTAIGNLGGDALDLLAECLQRSIIVTVIHEDLGRPKPQQSRE
jgi:hypothetical protein